MTMDPKILMAYVDGALPEHERDRIRALAAEDPALRQEIDRLAAQSQLVRDAFADVLDEPVPGHLVRAAQASPRWGSATRLRTLGVGAAAMAASFAAGFLLTPQFAPNSHFTIGSQGILPQGTLAHALSTQPSGIPVGAIEMAMTAPSTDGAFCRVFTIADDGSATNDAARGNTQGTTQEGTTQGVACTQGANWSIVALEQGINQSPSSGHYRTAGSGLSDTILSAMEARRTGDPLGREDEIAFLKSRGGPRQ